MIGGRLLVAGISVLLLSACTTRNSGSPVPASPNVGESTAATTTTGATPSSTAHLLPPRPRDLDLSGVDPCKDALTPAQLHQLAYDLGYERPPVGGHVLLDDGRTCGYSSSRPTDQPSRDIGSMIIISTSAGAEVWITDMKNRSNTISQTTVMQFPALVVPHPNFVDICEVVVDVHDGQYLGVQSSASGQANGTSPDPYCAEAKRVAEMTIQTLSARR
jgi:hypothetical protein